MPKQKKKYAVCPCCGEEKHRTEMSAAISMLERIEKKLYKHSMKELGVNTYSSFIGSSFDWACDSCLRSKRVVPAEPGMQAAAHYPHLAYFDTPLVCRNCGADFAFSAAEKKLWYESLKFNSGAAPVACPTCRKDLRAHKLENKRLSEILKKEENELDENEISEVAAIYEKWGKPDQAAYYRSLARKRQQQHSTGT